MPPPTRSPLPTKAIIGLSISAVLLVTAVVLEIWETTGKHAILTERPANAADEPLLTPLPPNTKLPSPDQLAPPAPPMGPMGQMGPMGGMMPGQLPPGHPAMDGQSGPPESSGQPNPTGQPEQTDQPAPSGIPGSPAAGSDPAVRRGYELVLRNRCIVCHSLDGRRLISTPFLNLYGKTSELVDGSKVKVDDGYIRESILDPQAKIVKIVNGPQVPMPSFKDLLSNRDINDIIAYLKSISNLTPKPAPAPESKSAPAPAPAPALAPATKLAPAPGTNPAPQ
ncbi:MAG: c-type cytochrome [Planctomycetota bacterium]